MKKRIESISYKQNIYLDVEWSIEDTVTLIIEDGGEQGFCMSEYDWKIVKRDIDNLFKQKNQGNKNKIKEEE